MTLAYRRPAVLAEVCGQGRPPRHLVVEASAGTGKTLTLEHAVIELLLASVPVEKLLVVTFTDRATYELRERVRALLANVVSGNGSAGPAAPGDVLVEIDGEGRARLERALAGFDRAPIHTIHAFCQRVLSESAFPSGRLFEQQLVDARTAFASGFRHVLRHHLARDPGRAVDLAAWLREHTVEELEDLLFEIDQARAEVRPLLDEAGLLAEIARLEKGCRGKSLDQVRAAVLASSLHGAKRKAIADRLDALVAFLGDPEARGSLVGLHVSPRLGYICGYLLEPPDREAEIRLRVPRIGDLLDLLARLRAKLVGIEAAAAQVFLPAVRERVAFEKRTKGLYDFDDMLSIVRDAVKQGPEREPLLARLRERWDHVLIDEFQDTDEVQWAIFEEVFAKSPAHGLWVIGDPKQSIYGWRGADVFAYLDACATLLEGRSPIPLRRSFRATRPLVDACNVLFDQTAQPPFFRDRIRYDAPVECGRDQLVALDAEGAHVAPVHVFDLDAATLTADSVRTTLASRIASEVRRLLDEGLWFGEKGSTRRLEASDVFILTRTGREGEFVSGFFAERGVPFAFYRQDGLFQTREADDVYRVLAAVAAPRDRSKRRKAWLTAFFGLELRELEGGDPPGEHACQRVLARWTRLAERSDFRRLFASMVEDTGLIRREILLSTSERRLTNYLHIFEVLLETVGSRRLGLRELAHLLRSWIRDERSPEGANGNVQRLESDAKAVQIMTLHKSKGLEAPVVFLFGGFTDPRGSSRHVYHDRPSPKTDAGLAQEKLETVFYHDPAGRRLIHVGPLTPDVRALVQSEGDEESRRLLYVGATRARARLYLPGFSRVSGVDGSPWRYEYLNGAYVHLAERIDALVHGAGPPPPGFEVEKVPVTAAPAAATPPANAAAPWTPDAEILAVEAAPELGPRRAPAIVTSYSRMKKGFLPTAAEIEADTLQEESPAETGQLDPEADGDPVPRGGANTGHFFHEVLERLPFESFEGSSDFDAWREREAVKPLFVRAMSQRGIPARQLAGAQRMVWDTLTRPLALGDVTLARGLAPCTKNVRELEFAYPIPEDAHLALPQGTPFSIERGWVRGFIDFVFEHEGRAYVVDWKTDSLDDYGPDSVAAHVRESYWIQVQVYTLALARLLGIRGPADHGARFGGILYCFLRGMRKDAPPGSGVFFERPDHEALGRLERDLIAFEYR